MESAHLVRIGEVARDLGLSASRVRQLADEELIPSTRTEVFRVWPSEHPDVTVRPANMVGPVEAMVRRGLPRRSGG